MQIDYSLIPDRLKHWTVIGFCISIFFYFVIRSFIGDNGLLKVTALNSQIASTKLEVVAMQKERKVLETRTKLLRPDNLDLDMLDERARTQLGLTKPNEYVVYYK
jgi:cell division protein FtsB